MDKTARNWRIINTGERLVLMYEHFYTENPGPEGLDYHEQYKSFLYMNRISADKIIKVEPVGAGHEIVHVLADGPEIEPYALVAFYPPDDDAMIKMFKDKHGVEHLQKFIFLGEIPNMPGHCVVADYATGILTCGLRTEYFAALNEI